jgi:hypothetical protein
MKELKYKFIGWNKNNSSDKIWGAIELISPKVIARVPTPGMYLIFWGRRGTKYQTQFLKSYSAEYSWKAIIDQKISEKINKRYKIVGKNQLIEVYPDFEKDISDTAFWTMMTKTDKLSLEDWEEIKSEIF